MHSNRGLDRGYVLTSYIILMVGFILSACSYGEKEQEPTILQNNPSQAGQLSRSSPDDQGMDPEKLEDMVVEMKSSGLEHHSVIIIRNGSIILEEHFENDDFGPAEPHPICSGTKSIVSILIGIAVDEGHIKGVEQAVLELFPGRDIKNLDPDKKSIKLKDLLSMSSGLRCRDSYVYDYQDMDNFSDSFDRVQYVLDLPMEHIPGKEMNYCNGVSHLLSAIITKQTGMSTSVYAYEKLFKPLGIKNVVWGIDARGINLGYTDVYLKPLDMAKIGVLYLNNGIWGEKQILSSDWVAESTIPQSHSDHEDRGYGYQWWVEEEHYYYASGAGGQFIFVVPQHNLVVVFTNELYGDDFWIPEMILNKFIIPALN